MTDRTAVVTGARRGLGLAVCRILARKGYRVILTARTLERAAAPAAALAAEGLEVQPFALDVTSEESMDALFAHVRETFGRLDVLVNNAATVFEASNADTMAIPASMVAQAFDTNTLSAYRMLLRAIPMMNAQGYGRVVNVSSGMGGIAEMGGGNSAYRISKAALNAVTRLFDHEARGDVKVNAVCPGWVRTDMGGEGAPRSIDEGVAGLVWAATLPADGPSGGFFRDGEPVPW